MKNNTTSFWIFILILCVSILGFSNLFIGEISVSIKNCFNAFFNYDPNSLKQLIIHELRIPRVSMAILSGVALAISGRVPTKVTGAVAAGDLMVSAGNGMAMANNDAKIGTVIGKAIEAHEGGEGIIEVLALMM